MAAARRAVDRRGGIPCSGRLASAGFGSNAAPR
jgi:hypothetical protein